jgi:hypothetical protein
MSCYNWEHGEITIPTKAWAKFRTALIKAWNEREVEQLALAKRLHAKGKEAIQGKRGRARDLAMRDFVWDQQAGRNHHLLGHVVRLENGKHVLKNAPKKKDFKVLPTSQSCTLHLDGDATITLNNTNRTVTWSVAENNRAVEHAHEHEIAKTLFRLLGRIAWTRGSGGEIVGNDEYNRDCSHAGGGGNYVTRRFG